MKNITYALTLYLLSAVWVSAQSTTAPNNATQTLSRHNTLLVRADYGLQFPAADMAKRYGWNAIAGIGLDYKTSHNWLIGIEGRYLFGTRVNEDSLAINIATEDNYIIGESGIPADIDIEERGWWTGLKVGRVFSVSPKQPDGGIFATIGLGYLQHQIRLQDLQNDVPQFFGNYIKGYDRLTGGWSVAQSIGYLHLPDKGFRFFIALDAIQGFTQSKRDYNFDTQTSDHQQRLDVLLGARVAWVLPIYTGKGISKDGKKEKRYYTD
ncbi:MAG: hypothetical protein IPL33_21970 [Sphingobacteriales bacterium]|nr:hypothetical protein [Sphingobacteriales bacterium]MCC7222787.1 hypothetical protein [Chitinophagales bacterium]